MGSKDHVLDEGPDTPQMGALLSGDMPAIVMFLRMSALHIVCLPLWANVPAHLTWQTNAFAVRMTTYFGHLFLLVH